MFLDEKIEKYVIDNFNSFMSSDAIILNHTTKDLILMCIRHIIEEIHKKNNSSIYELRRANNSWNLAVKNLKKKEYNILKEN